MSSIVESIPGLSILKENKYLIHEISPTRTELRLITQNIREEDYLRGFYRLGKR